MKVKESIKKFVHYPKSVIHKPLSYPLSSLVFLTFFLVLLYFIMPQLNLYVSIRDSVVSLGAKVGIIIKKNNELDLYIGHSDSSQGLKEDNYKITFPGSDKFITIWFAINNPNEEETYKDVSLFLQFLDENKKVDGKDEGHGGWVKFKDNHFNYGVIIEIIPRGIAQTNPLNLKFPNKGQFKFQYTLYAEGYKPKSGLKIIIVG